MEERNENAAPCPTQPPIPCPDRRPGANITVEIDDEVGQTVLSPEEVVRLVSSVLEGEGCGGIPCEASVSFVSVDEIHRLNREYRGIDRPTDVLSFSFDDLFETDDEDDDEYDGDDACEDDDSDDADDEDNACGDDADDEELLESEETVECFTEGLEGFDDVVQLAGDVIICPEVVEGQAEGFGNTVADEMRLLLVHGCLHLMGYDHETPEEAREMEDLERRYLAAFASVPPEDLNVGPTVDHSAEGSAACPCQG